MLQIKLSGFVVAIFLASLGTEAAAETIQACVKSKGDYLGISIQNGLPLAEVGITVFTEDKKLFAMNSHFGDGAGGQWKSPIADRVAQMIKRRCLVIKVENKPSGPGADEDWQSMPVKSMGRGTAVFKSKAGLLSISVAGAGDKATLKNGGTYRPMITKEGASADDESSFGNDVVDSTTDE